MAASHSSSGPLAVPTAMVSATTMHTAVLALTRQHQAEKMALQQELNQLKAVLAAALKRHPSLSQSERASARAVVSAPHVKDASWLDSDCGGGSHHSRSGSRFSNGRSRTRSPSIVLPAYCTAGPSMPPDEAAGTLTATTGNVSMPLQDSAPPRWSRTLPRHSCSYDSSIAVPECAAAPTVVPTRVEARLNSGCSVSLLNDESPRRSAPLTPRMPFPVAPLRELSEDGVRDCHQRQQDEYARLREALLQQL
nr:unnamed protein product [Leishmania braziliensis]CAJ2467581.1 unnamed protein product [Leishmania braziliensis]